LRQPSKPRHTEFLEDPAPIILTIMHLLGQPPAGWLAASEISPKADRA
jgi:hypothetical protein